MTHPANTVLDLADVDALLAEPAVFGPSDQDSARNLVRRVERAVIEKLGASEANPVPILHLAVAEGSNVRWMSGRALPAGWASAELYAVSGGGVAPDLYDATALAQAKAHGRQQASAELDHLRRLAELVTRADEDRATRDWDSQRLNWAEAYDEARKAITARQPAQEQPT